MLDQAVKTGISAPYRPHWLHDPARAWPETNCYVDLWIEALAQRGHDPVAALGFTLRQDFEGDQFTFFKFPLEDLGSLFGVSVQELAIFDDLEQHTLKQLERGRLVLVEVDGYYLPDTEGVSYRRTHPKTTIGVTALDPSKQWLAYFHNAGHFELSGDDYAAVFRTLPEFQNNPDLLFPYVEFAKFDSSKASPDQSAKAISLLKHHWRFRPRDNPVRAFIERFQRDIPVLMDREPEFFHVYAFNTMRQLGANFGLLAEHLDWLGERESLDFSAACVEARLIEAGAKAFQFQLARAIARKRPDGLSAQLEPIAHAYDKLMKSLANILSC
jgi:hypothetical protein